MYAIKVEGLTKQFNNFVAVDHISFSVKSGEIFGLLGPNGAGKTTTINMLSTLLNPSSGYAEVAGFDITTNRDDVRRNIGIVFQEPALDDKLTGRENLEFHAMMYGLDKEERRKRIENALELVELTDKADILVENYSGGMKRRLEIARGLIHEPKVLFLDEPTLGLDAQTRRHIWEYIRELNKKSGVTLILTTHYMEEADYLCDRIAIIDHGKIIAMDTPQRLKDVLGGDVISVEVEADIDKLMDHLRGLSWIKAMKRHDEVLDLTVEKGEKRIPELISTAQKVGVSIASINLHEPSLEDVFIHFTGKNIRDEGSSNNKIKMKRLRR
ncbi:ATP-binding cassette domain-containing protein [Methermicoccus shengliensis]|uniref:ATP-binding cassette domain-containing protein n=1 Tax=Methermicoccus shengliensis TaxID=660064 RepID=A0A832RW83_9EURY|nr:ATP-binding cassette domain-containing protein [Methermicoccus shengliensis]KUK04187.1 MAG: ABC transporter, ATP-binding protein [Euryarchaeota archaeon 55_53]KUK29888.1 MAG: ABC transporter, ATP-binding protein [Methanosarcinales archeaon 56_1174]MDI3488376.1 type transport system ATP-binding protein [Methanosarcinales archaeon]MDN5295851.1 type transport system ATP-binding protein [Methanosarcinales archaeon]HIH69491.1 ATP-binding cassette domain-containing protein [Methermicoccus shengli